jgi:hypothetical protein
MWSNVGSDARLNCCVTALDSVVMSLKRYADQVGAPRAARAKVLILIMYFRSNQIYLCENVSQGVIRWASDTMGATKSQLPLYTSLSIGQVSLGIRSIWLYDLIAFVSLGSFQKSQVRSLIAWSGTRYEPRWTSDPQTSLRP